MAGNTVKSFNCPACGGVVEIHAAGHSISAVCGHCSTLIDTANDNFKIIKKEREANRNTDIEIGAKGILDGIKWEVIGYVEKQDKAAMSSWEEYLLFNPYFGFRFLVHADGHWNFAKVVKRYLRNAGNDNEAILDDEKFNVYCRGLSTVEYVKGEFYWRVRKGDAEKYTDYIAPPKMLSIERGKQEVTASLAVYVEPEIIAKVFGVDLRDKVGVAANQPAPFAGRLGKIWKTASLSILAAFIIQLSTGSATFVTNTHLNIEPSNRDKTYSTSVFNLPQSTNLSVKSFSPLSNNWMELDLMLVNENTNVAYQSRQVIEYYSGYEEGESWSEGGQVTESTFSAIPEGDYRLVVDPSYGYQGLSAMDVNMELRRGVKTWGNFWVVFLSIIVFPLFALIYRWNFESKRWENSDYAPAIYQSGESDD